MNSPARARVELVRTQARAREILAADQRMDGEEADQDRRNGQQCQWQGHHPR